jgi:ubiquinol oxidase
MQIKRVHFAEEFNEAHHLLTMEALGGDARWADRFFAFHSAIVYYWVLVLIWLVSPTLAYNFSELIESHAVDTYAEFVDANEALLKSLPAPPISRYYWLQETYMFDEFQTGVIPGTRRPKIENLYDVFCAIRDDEAAHVSTMADCQDRDFLAASPNYEAAVVAAALAAAAVVSMDEELGDVATDAATDLVGIIMARLTALIPFL